MAKIKIVLNHGRQEKNMQSIIGGILIGSAASIMLLFNGRVTGISGILGSLLSKKNHDNSWRIFFIAGLLIGGIISRLLFPASFLLISSANSFDYCLAGLLVGFGTLMGNGCTSGHGVCGISRLSVRSLIATIVFILSGMISVILFKMLRGSL